MKKAMTQTAEFARGRAFLVGALCALILSGCISPMTSELASERIKGLSDVMQERRILASDAELVVKLMKDPDPDVRAKAFDVFVNRQIQVEHRYEAFWVWIITREYAYSGYGYGFQLEGQIARITDETDASVRAAMWKSLSEAYSHKDRYEPGRGGSLEEDVIRGRYPESVKKEFVKVIWSGKEKEVELLNRLSDRLGDSFVTVLRLIDDPDVIESFMRKKKKDNPDVYRHGSSYQDAAKRLAEIDKKRFAKYALANCADLWDVDIAVEVLDDEDLLTVIVLKGLRDINVTDDTERSRIEKALERYLRKVQTEKFVFKVLETVEMDPDTARLFLDALKDEDLLAKALCNQAILEKAVYEMSEGGIRVLHKYVHRVQKDENLVEIVKANTRLSPYALKSVGNQDFLYQVLLKKVPLSRYLTNEEEVKKIVMERLDDAHKKAYQKSLDDAAKKAWHRKFDPLMKKAEAGDVGAMREVADDALERNEMGVAASWYTKICEADTNDVYACVQAGDCYAATKDSTGLKEARKYYARAVARGWENARPKLNLVSLRLKHPELSEGTLNQVVQRFGGQPDRQSYYEYAGGMGPGRYKIFQAVPARRGVLVQAAAFCDSAFYDLYADNYLKRDLLFIETDEPYVDGDWLKEGVFLYAGRYTYQTSSGGSNSVHMFREWKSATDLKTLIVREGSDIIGMFGVRFGVMPQDLSAEDVGKVGQPVPIPESDGGGFSFTYDYQGNHGIWDEFSFQTGGDAHPSIYKVMASKSYADEAKALSDAQELLGFLKERYGIPTTKNPLATEGKVWLQMFDQPRGTVLLAVKVFEKGGKYHLTYSLSDFTKDKKAD